MFLPPFFITEIKNTFNYFKNKNVDFSKDTELQNLISTLLEEEEIEKTKIFKTLIYTRLFNYLKNSNKSRFENMKEAINGYIQSVERFRFTDFPVEMRNELSQCLIAMKKTNYNMNIVCNVVGVESFEEYDREEGCSSSLILQFAEFLKEFQYFLTNKLQIKYNLDMDRWLYIYNHIGKSLKIPNTIN
jgi:hypothetical protein